MVGSLRISVIGQKGKIGVLIHCLAGFPTGVVGVGCPF